MKTWLAALLSVGCLACDLRAAEPFFVDLAPIANTRLENNGQEGWCNEGVNDMFIYPPIPTGEAGMLMCTFPRQDWSFENASGKGNTDGCCNLFNEVMNGFEYQVAGHMIWEGLVQEGLAVTRAVHDRHHPSKRNPWNEVECGDHYSRSLASYGVFLAACGFEHHGPKQHIGFAPKLTPENFKCAFTSAEGWGSYAQEIKNGILKAEIFLRWGKMQLRTLALEFAQAAAISVKVELAGKTLPAQLTRRDSRVVISLPVPLDIYAGQSLVISLT